MRFGGIYTPIITPFRDDLSIDFGAYGEIIDWQVEHGVHGIIVGGSTGEFFSLTCEERIEQFRFAVARAAGRLPVIAGVNDLSITRCHALTSAAKSAGVDALLVAAPPYSLPDQQELVAHCLEIDRLADLPIMLYNYPGRTGVSMQRPFLERIVEHGNFRAIKESSGELERIHLLAGEFPQLQLSAGAEHLVLEFFAWGARSWVSVIANFLPGEAVRLYESCVLGGDFAKGRRMLSGLQPLLHHLENGGQFLQSVKFACESLGRPGGPVRPPMLPLTESSRAILLGLVETARHELRATLASEDAASAAGDGK